MVINSGGQFLAFDCTYNVSPYTFTQNFSLNGFGWGEGGEQLACLPCLGDGRHVRRQYHADGRDRHLRAAQPSRPDHGQRQYQRRLSAGDQRRGNTSYVFTLSGSNNYTGPTTIGGTVDLSNSAALLETTLTPVAGTIEFDQSVGGGVYLRRAERHRRDHLSTTRSATRCR